jgi:cytochrome P450
MGERPPVEDWATDFDHLTREWAADGPDILTELRERCPVAHTERFHGAYLVTRYDDVVAVAQDAATFSSRTTMVTDVHPDEIKLSLGPLTLDPPLHAPLRRALLPTFNPRRVDELRPVVEQIVEELLDDLAGGGTVDGATQFAELVPIGLMSHLFGVPRTQGVEFRHWVNGVLKDGLTDIEIASASNRAIQGYFVEQLRARQAGGEAADDLVSMVLEATITEEDGTTRPLTAREQIGSLYVLLLGGIDTTWSLIGAALLHFGTHPDDLARLVAEPELLPTAIEELLRFYSPATVGRLITEDADVGGCPVDAGQRLLLSFPSANRDASQFERAEEVVLDRQHNRHIAFGAGIHRCIGSNLARMETEVALRGWLRRFPRFELAGDPADIRWSNGAVRGPHHVPLRILGLIPHATYVDVADATHMVAGDRNDAFTSAVREFAAPLLEKGRDR